MAENRVTDEAAGRAGEMARSSEIAVEGARSSSDGAPPAGGDARSTDVGHHGVIDLGFLDHYMLLDATRRRAVQHAAEHPVTITSAVAQLARRQALHVAAVPPELLPAPGREAAPEPIPGPGPGPGPAAPPGSTPVPAAAPATLRGPAPDPSQLAAAKRRPGAARAARPRRARVGHLPLRRDRREEVLERLAVGPASAQELAELFEISREGVLRWLRLLEADGKIRPTAQARTSRTNRWVLSDGPRPPGAPGGASPPERSPGDR